MSLSITNNPILIFFESHFDETPKKAIIELLPTLIEKMNYDTYCLEYPSEETQEKLRDGVNKTMIIFSNIYTSVEKCLKEANISCKGHLGDMNFNDLINLIKKYVSEKDAEKKAEAIKTMRNNIATDHIYEIAKKNNMLIKGIDIDRKTLLKIFTMEHKKRDRQLHDTLEIRDEVITNNLLKLYNERKGVIVSLGCAHTNVISKLKASNVPIKYFLSHHPKQYIPSIETDSAFLNHSYSLSSPTEIISFLQQVIKEVELIRYKREVLNNSHSLRLSEAFKVPFKAFERSEHFVDALLNIDSIENAKNINEKLQKIGIQTKQISLQGQKHLVISNVNTKEVGDLIFTLEE